MEQDYKRLRQKISVFMVVSLGMIIGSASIQGHFETLFIGAILIVFYIFWTKRYVLPQLLRSGETLSLDESMTSQARAFGAVGLWLLEIGALAFVACSIFIFVVDPSNWITALASVVFFGLGAVQFARMLVLQRRATINKP